MNKFKLVSKFSPKGDQPKAIEQLSIGLKQKLQFQTLLGATGTGKTYTIAGVIENYQKPTLVLAHNKTLAAQLFQEFKELFPNNRVEYFISYYDFYRPESYLPIKDVYIEKEATINEKIEQLRLSTTASLMSRNDTIVVASVSCIFGLGNPENFKKLGFNIEINQNINRNKLIKQLINIQYERNDTELEAGRFRVKGDTVDIIPGYYENIIRIEFFGDKIEQIKELEKTSNKEINKLNEFFVFPAKHFVVSDEQIKKAKESIFKELEERLPELEPIEAHRLKKRTKYDLEMISEAGYCPGIENYSRHFDNRRSGQRPFCLLDYFSKDYLLVIDESHQTIPQIKAMYKGDYARKKNLVDYGFRLPSAFDNRPLKFSEFQKFMNQTIFVSATPSEFEINKSKTIAEQIIRPTGLVDPQVYIKPIKGQIENLIENINLNIKKGYRSLVTTLTKKLAEEVSEYLSEKGIKTRYLHSEINTLERQEIIRELRLGKFDCLVGINLLREGLDIPEVAFIGILDADKEGFLRDKRSLIQTIGRAARNSNSYVHLYADKITDSIKNAIEETKRRRETQIKYNKDNNITPKTIIKAIKEKIIEVKDIKHIPKGNIPKIITQLEKEMKQASDNLEFENAIIIRDKINMLKNKIKNKSNK
jgi:excinuclease ABC subunit B